jgi:two-component system response regulator (stage 0 sporulation protein F)
MEKKVRILVIDDNETFCRLLTEILESEGMEVAWTTDGLAGYDMSTRSRYDLFIIDVRMPLVVGTELAEVLKKENPSTKIILVSAFADAVLQKVSRNLGVTLLSKPFNASRLLEVVETTLGSEQAED